MRKREGMEAFKLSIPSRFFTTKKCIFSIRRMEVAPLAGAWIEIKIQ